MNIAFCTCVQLGLSCIEAITTSGSQFDLFLTLHDQKSKRKSGRIYLDEVANEFQTPLVKINHINEEDSRRAILNHEIDWLFIIGWSQIASPELISLPKKGVIGAHPTLLPQGRGRASIPWAILKGLDKTGVTFFKMDEGVDTGDIILQEEIPLSPNETATQLYQKVNDAHVNLMKTIWPLLQKNTLVTKQQNSAYATYWEGRKPEDGIVTSEMTVEETDRLVRATTQPYPGAFLRQPDGGKQIIWKGSIKPSPGALPIQCKNGIYYATEIENHPKK